ncbi:hypothetical protein HDU80_004639 [Chytriomyces hyalinus]|nr:hypothetical protein HDU80_004639 [Chytriomyces hyalinus]
MSSLSPSVSNASILDDGIRIWATMARTVRWKFQPAVSDVPGAIIATDIVKQFIDGLAFSSFLLFLAILVLLIGIYTRCVGFKTIPKKALFHTSTKWFTLFSFVLSFVCIIIGVICGAQGSRLISTYISQIPSKTNNLATDAQSVVSQIPSAVSLAVRTIHDGMDETVDTFAATIKVPTRDLVGPGVAGTELLAVLERLVEFQRWVEGHAGVVDANVTGLDVVLSQLQIDLDTVSNDITNLNSEHTSPQRNIQFQLRSLIKPIPDSTNQQLAYTQAQIQPIITSPLSSGEFSNHLQSLPNLTRIHAELNSSIMDPWTVINKTVLTPIKSNIHAQVSESTQGSTATSQEFARNMTRLISELNSTTVVEYIEKFGIVKYDRDRYIFFAVVLGASVIVMVGLMGVVMGRSLYGMKLQLTGFAIVTFLTLILAIIMFCVAVGVAETCTAFNDKNAVFISIVSPDAGERVLSFHKARQTCLERGTQGGLVQFAVDMGADPSLLNITLKASTVIDNINVAQYVDLSQLLSNATNLVSNQDFNNTISDIESSWTLYLNLIQQNLLSNKTVLNAIQQVTDILNRLESIDTTSASTLAAFKVTGTTSQALQLSDAAQFFAEMRKCAADLSAALVHLNGLLVVLAVLSRLVEQFQGLAEQFELDTRKLPGLSTAVEQVATAFGEQVLANITTSMPEVKQQLYRVTANASQLLDDGMDCTVLALDTVAIQDSVCSDLSLSIDSVWLAFTVIGLGLFVVLCIHSCIVSEWIHRSNARKHVRHRTKSNMSMTTSYSSNPNLSSSATGLAVSRSKQFGKETPKILDSRHAEDMLDISPSLPRNSSAKGTSVLPNSHQTLTVEDVSVDWQPAPAPVQVQQVQVQEMREISRPERVFLVHPPSYNES